MFRDTRRSHPESGNTSPGGRGDAPRQPLAASYGLPAALFATALMLGSGADAARADDHDDIEVPFAEANLFFELNNTDGDLGIHAKIDGDAWRKLEIEDFRGREILQIDVKGRLKKQGLTEIFFESAEPPFDELAPEQFFARFPEGIYEAEGMTLDGVELESEMELTHVMPAPPDPTINGLPKGEQCDDEMPGFDAPIVGDPVTIAWPAVTMSHPDPDGGGAAVQPPVPVTIVNYEVVLEVDIEVGDSEFTAVSNTILPPDQTAFTVPDEFLALGDQFKFEVLAREESFNQTATESCFVLE